MERRIRTFIGMHAVIQGIEMHTFPIYSNFHSHSILITFSLIYQKGWNFMILHFCCLCWMWVPYLQVCSHKAALRIPSTICILYQRRIFAIITGIKCLCCAADSKGGGDTRKEAVGRAHPSSKG